MDFDRMKRLHPFSFYRIILLFYRIILLLFFFGLIPISCSYKDFVEMKSDPRLLKPLNNQRIMGKDIVFSWENPAPLSEHCTLELWLDGALVFTESISNSESQGNTVVSLVPKVHCTPYVWFVRVKNHFQIANSEPRVFYVLDDTLKMLISPMDQALLNCPEQPTFSWKPLPCFSSYRFVLSKRDDLSNPIQDVIVPTAEMPTTEPVAYLLDAPLDQVSLYYWAAFGIVDEMQTISGSIFSFTMASNQAPELIFPSNGSQISCANLPVFSWSHIDCFQDYRLKISRDPSFQDIVLEELVTGNSYTLKSALPEIGHYYWVAQGINGSFETGLSDTSTFDVIESDPPTLLFPANNARFSCTSPLDFAWSTPCFDQYKVFVSLKEDCSGPFLETLVQGGTTTFDQPLEGFDRYYWQVMGTSDSAQGSKSQISSFILSDILPPSLFSPSNLTRFDCPAPITFLWEELPCATSYHLAIEYPAENPVEFWDEIIIDSTFTWTPPSGKLGNYAWKIYEADSFQEDILLESDTYQFEIASLVDPFVEAPDIYYGTTTASISFNSVAGVSNLTFAAYPVSITGVINYIDITSYHPGIFIWSYTLTQGECVQSFDHTMIIRNSCSFTPSQIQWTKIPLSPSFSLFPYGEPAGAYDEQSQTLYVMANLSTYSINLSDLLLAEVTDITPIVDDIFGIPVRHDENNACFHATARQIYLFSPGVENNFGVYSLDIDALNGYATIATTSSHPNPRWDHHVAFVPSENALYVAQGQEYSSESAFPPTLDDLWRLDLNTSPAQWTYIVPGADNPPGRAAGFMNYVPSIHSLVLFGGRVGPNANELLNDVWIFSLETQSWSQPSLGGTKPLAVQEINGALVTPCHILYTVGTNNGIFSEQGKSSSSMLDVVNLVWLAVAESGYPTSVWDGITVFDTLRKVAFVITRTTESNYTAILWQITGFE